MDKAKLKKLVPFKKIKVIDTNVLIADPQSIFKFPEQLIILPISVLEELDNFKQEMSERGKNTREVMRKLDKLRTRGSISSTNPETYHKKTKKGEGKSVLGVALDNKGRLVVELNHTDLVPAGLDPQKVDNRILAVALFYKKSLPDVEVAVISKDINVRIKADSLGLKAEDYISKDIVKLDESYKGYREVLVTADEIEEFESSGKLKISTPMLANEYAILINKENKHNNVIGRFDKKQGLLVPLFRTPDAWGLKPANVQQVLALDLLFNPDIPLVTLTGKAGTGKTLLAVAAALKMTADEGVYDRVLISRPVMPMGKDIGYLPGTIEEKLNPWMQPIFDNLDFLMSIGASKRRTGSKNYEELINQGLMKVEPLTYIRGRSIPNQFMIVDESQNLSIHEIKTIVTRVGEGTKIIFTGDPDQIDNPYIDSQSNGLSRIMEIMKDEELTGHMTLTQGARSPLAEMASEKLK